jgi:ubiquinone/menaquinone biosynthesis C-methylase UbiE
MTQPRGYVDRYYLDAMAELIKRHKQRTYTWMHLQAGHVVLDVGCGSGTDTLALAELVGPTGRVVGVDVDATMVAEADRRAEQAGCGAWCHHQQADATALPLERCVFDACRSERLFQHAHNAAAILAGMVRVTRPGGWVVVLEPDWGTLSLDTPQVEIERRLARVRAEQTTNNGYAGRQLYALFKRQGLTEITVELHPLSFTSYALFRYATVMERVERDAQTVGLLTEAELQRWRQHLEEAETTGTFFAHMLGVLVAGRKAVSTRD